MPPPTPCCCPKPTGQPVRVQWSREDELGWDPKGPPQLLELRAALDDAGRIAHWEAEMWVPLATANLAHVPLLAPREARAAAARRAGGRA